MAHLNFLPWILHWFWMPWCSHFASEMQTQKKDPKVLEIIELLLDFRFMMSSDTDQVLFLFFPTTLCSLQDISSLTGIEPRSWQWKHWDLSTELPGNFLLFPQISFNSVFCFHIPHLWTIQTGKKQLFSSWPMKGTFSLLPTEAMFLKFSHSSVVSSVRNPVKPTPPRWNSQPHPQRSTSPKIPKICAQ